MDYAKIAAEIIKDVGGKENIISAMHCATRLRLRLKDYGKVDTKKLEDVDQVKGVFLANDQQQVILGSGTVNLVTDEVLKQTGLGNGGAVSEEPAKKEGSWLTRAVKGLSDIFVPIIPAIVAGGLLMGINNVLTAVGLFAPGKSLIDMAPQFAGLATFINMCASAPFTFLPVLLGFSAAKKFGGNPYLGAAMGMVMVHPDLLNAYSIASVSPLPTWNILGLEVQSVGYQGTVLPVLAVAWILSKIEIFLHKHTPSWLDNLSTPMLSLLITSLLTFTIVGPVMRSAGDLLAVGLSWLYGSLGMIGGAIFGLLYAPITMTGMHHSFIAIETQLIAAAETTGGSFIFPIAAMNNVAQGAAVLAVLFLTKNEKMKSLCTASGISALLGITEPAMFGVTLKLRWPFIAAIIGSACGSAWIAGTHTLALALGTAGLPGFISIDPKSWGNYFIGMAISMAASFALTFVFMKRHPEGSEESGKPVFSFKKKKDKKDTETKTETAEPAVPAHIYTESEDHVLCAPVAGKVSDITACSDAVFSSKAMGNGVVIDPANGRFYAPADCEVVMLFPTRHAIGLKTEDGTEILIHIGMDTVSLDGKPFTAHVQNGEKLKAGDLMIEADLDAIRAAGLSVQTPVIITNKVPFECLTSGTIAAGEKMMKTKA
ncbi:sucrose-specific PTS transporter subunit IIBC [Allobaculum mucilyticum]|uniref:sucrose-specific PTS transporter subunit IIBC n=1 Tax=Allobaculum mucilyticum TaxID=2834459 RepID=UPI001E37B609|nr:sucrose-specific PTS transporter subunit IIBC [Allobaculum mucilyticum]UNT96924.1 sucrose-specific PTS transporter subunit IIBC [Allobaculum mucilyticum]